MYTIVVNALLFIVSTVRPTSVYFYDYDGQQTYPLSPTEVLQGSGEEMEHQILTLLGLPDSPRPSNKHLRSNAAPQFMMHLYKEVQKQDGFDDVMSTEVPSQEDIGPEFRNISYDVDAQEKVTSADVVISFINQVGKHKLGLDHEDDKRFLFMLDDVPDSSLLNDAELRVYKQRLGDRSENFFITVFKIESSVDEKFGLSMLDNLVVNSSYEGWLVFNVSSAMESWMGDRSSNAGLYLQVLATSGDEVLPHRVGIVGRHGEEAKQGFMVAFFKSLIPLTKSISSIMPLKTRVKRSTSADQTSLWESPDSRRYSRKHCQRKSLFIKFKRLRFDSWIIAPEGYPAFYCEGECSFPLSSNMNATNHAIVQTLVSLIQPKKFPRACCAPKKLSTITVLYFDDTQNVVMKRYANMAVQSCGCH